LARFKYASHYEHTKVPFSFCPVGCRYTSDAVSNLGVPEVISIPRAVSQSQTSSRPYLTALAVALIFGVAVYFRLYNLGGRDLWTDEAWVALAAMQPSARAALAASQSTPPFYLLTVWAAAQLWGHSEIVLRGLSFGFGVGTLVLIWRLGCALLEIPAAMLAMAAVAFSPIMVYYSKELKQYSGDAFFAVLMVWLAERLRTAQGGRGWLALALAGVVGLGFSHALIFTLPIIGAILWATLPPDRRSRLVLVGAAWILAFATYYVVFIRREVDPELVAYWTQDFPNFSGLVPFIMWWGSALYRYFWYFLGEWGMFWGPVLLAAGMVVLVRQGRTRVLLYLAGPLLLAFAAACLHRYPFMAHYGGNRLMLFSAPVLYLIIAAGGWAVFAWLWLRRQRWLALALTAALMVALHPRTGLQEDLYPLNNREEIQPLVTYLEANLEPRDLVYVYYFAVAPFKYYYRGPKTGICWGQSCIEKRLDTTAAVGASPQRLWLIASHFPDLKFLRQFAANLLGPDWQETACFTRVGAVLLRFDQQSQAAAVKTPTGLAAPPECGDPDLSAGTAY
jgi:4-amino-4-deoxy-L-arabinose transferase-like glycosyltransferase